MVCVCTRFDTNVYTPTIPCTTTSIYLYYRWLYQRSAISTRYIQSVPGKPDPPTSHLARPQIIVTSGPRIKGQSTRKLNDAALQRSFGQFALLADNSPAMICSSHRDHISNSPQHSWPVPVHKKNQTTSCLVLLCDPILSTTRYFVRMVFPLTNKMGTRDTRCQSAGCQSKEIVFAAFRGYRWQNRTYTWKRFKIGYPPPPTPQK